MTRPDQIPDEAVEKAARALALAENRTSDEWWPLHMRRATAALRAGIAAWPGSEPLRRKNGQGKGIFLPFLKENASD
jgi:hypothetical protein